jgi:hypothetical protein
VNFFLQDLGGSILAACIFPVFLLLPGYIVADAVDIWQFRTRSLSARIALGVVLSISVTPGLTYFLARFVSLQFACAVFAILALIFVGSAVRKAIASGVSSHWAMFKATLRVPALIVLGWMGVAILLLSDLQLADRLYPNLVAHDYTMRIAVTNSITRTGIPPDNPSFYPGHSIPLYYYYFWFMTCSLVDLSGGALIGPRAAVIAGTAWVGVAIMAIVALYVRLLPPLTHAVGRPSVFIALALLMVGGFDFVPIACKYIYHFTEDRVLLYPGADWWNEVVINWPSSILWVPHHLAGLIATLSAFLIFSSLCDVHTPGKRALTVVVCALALFSALGLSVWMTFAFMEFWLAWIVIAYLKGWYMEARMGVLVGVLACGFSIPYLIDLSRANLTHIIPIIVTVRPFLPIHSLLENHHVPRMVVQTVDLFTLPLNYFIEFGFFALAAILYWRHRLQAHDTLGRNEVAFLTLAVSVTMVASFLRSNIYYNDLGWRSILFVQFVLLIWSAYVVQSLLGQLVFTEQYVRIKIRRGMAMLLFGSLIIGMTPILYDVVMMKLYSMAGDLRMPVRREHGFLNEANLGRRYYDFREAYDWIGKRFPESAVVQHNPDLFIDLPSGLYGDRQVAVADHAYGILFGIPAELYQPVSSAVSALFASRTIDMEDVSAVCRRFNITALVVKDTDPIWSDPDSWVFRKFPIFHNRSTRVFDCHSFL